MSKVKCNKISGGLNPESDEAYHHAERYYASIRKQSKDCIKIAKNTGYTVEVISLIKGYVFYCEHALTDGWTRFYPSYEMAESWRRLSLGGNNIMPHDLLLLKHELKEIHLIMEGYNQIAAHTIAENIYNYNAASTKFYAGQKFRQPKNTGGKIYY